MRIVVCGDSFNSYDDSYPGLHWADRLAPHEVYRLARPGASNFSIWHQVMQSKKFNPDVVLISFTSCPRVEYTTAEPDFFNELLAPWLRLMPGKQVWHDATKHLRKETPTDSLKELERKLQREIGVINHAIPGGGVDSKTAQAFEQWARLYYIEPFEILKNYMYITHALDHMSQVGIRCYATLGRFTNFVGADIQGVQIDFAKYESVLNLPSGWDHGEKLLSPLFHIKDPEYHQNHADFVLKLLEE